MINLVLLIGVMFLRFTLIHGFQLVGRVLLGFTRSSTSNSNSIRQLSFSVVTYLLDFVTGIDLRKKANASIFYSGLRMAESHLRLCSLKYCAFNRIGTYSIAAKNALFMAIGLEQAIDREIEWSELAPRVRETARR